MIYTILKFDGLNLLATASERGIHSVQFLRDGNSSRDGMTRDDDHPLFDTLRRQLQEYLAGTRREFSLPLHPVGTEFQQRVWKLLQTIPYGETWTYGELARAAGNPKASRAVGMANNRNPLAIVIPCHRVIGANGSLTGYAGGLDIKQRLLELERSTRQATLFH